ncbi:MAG: glycosyltransferase [Lachnospiraceae bacterium]|nr:glycosyltransferase [Lachnospiraceae bacterium]
MALENVYEHYFEKGKTAIDSIINTLKDSGKTIAVWGAGQRGTAFLNIYDSHNERIDYVYDRNEKRYGTKMPTGHEIVDYRKGKADIVFVMNNAHEMDVKETLISANKNIDVMNIDNIILGNLEAEEVLKEQPIDLSPVRKIKVAALTILYNPCMDVYDNIITYADDVDIMYIYDNSDQPNTELVLKLQKLENLCYIANPENVGLPKAINEVARKAVSQGIDWLITFDQDSQTETHMIARMIEFAESKMCGDRVGIIAPNITREEDIVFERYYTYFDKVFQSGAMHNLAVLKEIGGYDESLFIDQVDYEYCIRMRLNGYSIIKINHAFLKHNMQDDDDVEYQFVNGTKMVINKYSSARYYYICRNNLYLFDKYKLLDPVYAHECEDSVMRIKKNAEVDLDFEKHKAAIDKAYEDYKNGTMGKVKW